jgi:hypothetical protein
MMSRRSSGSFGRQSQGGYGRLRAALVIVAAVAATLAAAAGCGEASKSAASASGGLEIVLVSDMSIPRDIDHVRLEVTQHGKSLLHVERDVGEGELLLPASFAVNGTGDTAPVTVQGVAYKGGDPRVERRAVTPIPSERVGLLRLALNYLCVGTAQADADGAVTSTCPDGTTCVQGSCETPKVSESSLPTYTPSDRAGVDGGAPSGCFDVLQCFSAALPVKVDTADCTLSLPSGVEASKVNVGLQFPAGSGGVCGPTACWVVFDQSSDWTENGGRVSLPPGACSSVAASGGQWVVTTACLPKTEANPVCGSWSSVSTPVTEPPPSTGPAPSCQGPSMQACGLCGTQARSCVNGVWSGWSACGGEGTCAAGTTEKCGADGTRTCSASCEWGPCECAGGDLSCGAAGDCAAPDDPATCGTCKNACGKLPNVSTRGLSCTKGTCGYDCAAGFADCSNGGDGCTTDLSELETCGTCGNDCTALTHVSGPTECTAGKCVILPSSCADGFADCNGDPSDGCETDVTGPDHCGGCDAVCSDATPLCAPSSKGSDHDNCGACGKPCTGDQTCVAGTCAGVCGPGQLSCNAQQPRSCGADGQWKPNGAACSASQVCQGGKCTGVCGPNQSETRACGNCNSGKQSRSCNPDGTWSAYSTCTGANDLKSDPANCGACGFACAAGSACQAGKCVCAGLSTQACGNCGTGTQTRTCGANGTWSAFSACSGGGACTAGATQTQGCAANSTATCSAACAWGACACNTGFSSCGGACINTQTDNANCGACGNTCTSGVTCQSGKCN